MCAINYLKNAFQFDLQPRSETHVRFAIVHTDWITDVV